MKFNQKQQVFHLVAFSIFAAIILLLSLANIGFIRIGPVAITIIHIPVLIGILILPLGYAVGLGILFGLGSLLASFIYATTPIDMAFQNPLISILPRAIFALIAFFTFFGLKKLQKTKFGDTIIFIIVSVITVVFFYFGGIALSQTIDPKNATLLKDILTPVFVGISGLVIGLYYYFINSKSLKQSISIPSSIMISTLIHTVLVLLAISIFKASALTSLGVGALQLIKIVVGTNGFIEIIVGVLIATPIAMALINAFPEYFNNNLLSKSKKKEVETNDLTV